jgi:hypothetical protein
MCRVAVSKEQVSFNGRAKSRKAQARVVPLSVPFIASVHASRIMKWLTHVFLHDLAREVKPAREVRDAFGLDSASCWCSFAISTSSHAKAKVLPQPQHRSIDTARDIELHCLNLRGRSRAIRPVTFTGASQSWQTPTPLPLRPPMAHCRPRTLNSSLNNPHSHQDQISPLSK